MSTYLTAATPAELPTLLPQAQSLSTSASLPLYIHIRADWCPDCTSTDATVRSALSEIPAVILEARVDSKSAYFKQDHPYRLHPLLKLQRMPTLLAVQSGRRLVEYDLRDEQKIRNFLEETRRIGEQIEL